MLYYGTDNSLPETLYSPSRMGKGDSEGGGFNHSSKIVCRSIGGKNKKMKVNHSRVVPIGANCTAKVMLKNLTPGGKFKTLDDAVKQKDLYTE